MPPKIKREFYEPGPHNHATYKNHHCDCDECREAYNVYVQQRRGERRALIIAHPELAPHGSNSTYTNWGCPCNECREDHNRVTRIRLARKREERNT